MVVRNFPRSSGLSGFRDSVSDRISANTSSNSPSSMASNNSRRNRSFTPSSMAARTTAALAFTPYTRIACYSNRLEG